MNRQESAETLALRALGWLAGNEEILPVFLGATGASLADLARGAARPDFLGSVLDFLLMDDAWVIGFCESAGYEYTVPMAARQALPGGAQTHWTRADLAFGVALGTENRQGLALTPPSREREES